MKKIVSILFAALAVAACFPEEINHPSEASIPEASGFEPVITVDQETNIVTFVLNEKGVNPVWVFQDSKGEWSDYHTGSGYSKLFAAMGDYAVRMYVMNAAGTSPDYVQKSFHIDNTLANFDRYFNFLAGGTAATNSKDWHVDGTVDNHLGCGPSGTEGLEWWAAKPGDKDKFGVYEDMVTFFGDGAYKYNPGEDGSTYVNIGVTVSPFVDQKGDATEDYNVNVDEQTASYKFEMHGNDLYLVLAEHTLFPYIDNDSFWAKPEFKVLNATREVLELVHDNGDIAWHFILTSKTGPVAFKGFKYNAESNLWLPADKDHTLTYWYAPGWNQIADPETTFENGEYTLTLPEATTDQWQAQFFINPTAPVVLSADKHYDFSVIVNTNLDLPGMTLKLTDVGDDGNFLFTERVAFKTGETIYYLTDLEGIDAPNGVKMVFDFGGNAAGTIVSLANIVVKDHAVDDGTVLPTDEPEDPNQPGGYTYGDNLLGSLALDSYWFSAADWSGQLNPNAKYEGGKLTLTIPDGIGGSEWQGQIKLVADIPADPEKQYAFFATIESGADGTCTVKVADANADAEHAFFYDNNVKLVAFEKVAYKNEPCVPDQAYEKVMVIFDFGRIAAGTEINVTGIELREITGTSGGQQGGYTYGEELLGGLAFDSYWFSAADWSGQLNPNAKYEGGKLTLTVPDGVGGSEWQGQIKLVAPVPANPDKQYSFSCTIESSTDGTCTVKVADANADAEHAFFYDNNVKLVAFDATGYKNEPIVPDQAYESVMVIFDFGRIAAGTEITVTNISLKEITGENPGGGSQGSGASYGDNILNGLALDSYWFSAADWSGQLNPNAKYEGGKLTLTVPDGIGGSEWQGQIKLVAPVPADPEKKYQFTCKIESSTDGTCTIKVADANDDVNHAFFYDNNVKLVAYDVVSYKNEPVSPDQAYDAVMVIFDFGRIAAGTEIAVTDIALCPEK